MVKNKKKIKINTNLNLTSKKSLSELFGEELTLLINEFNDYDIQKTALNSLDKFKNSS